MNKCKLCGKPMPLHSKLVWQEHEGLLYLVLSKDPDALKVTKVVSVCLECSIRILYRFLELELVELQTMLRNDHENEE